MNEIDGLKNWRNVPLTRSCVMEISPKTFVLNIASMSESAMVPTLSNPSTNPALFTVNVIPSSQTGVLGQRSARSYPERLFPVFPEEFCPTTTRLVPCLIRPTECQRLGHQKVALPLPLRRPFVKPLRGEREG